MRDRTEHPSYAGPLVSGRYAMYWSGAECGGERWEIGASDDGYTITGDQEIHAPHPLPSRQEYRAILDRHWRPIGLDVIWTVGSRRLVALHRAIERTWRVQIDYAGQSREQHGDYPDVCEVEYTTHLFNAVILARRDFQVGGEHEFPVLRIGPPLMAVTPERMIYRCIERGSFETALGRFPAKRYVVYLPSEGEANGYTFWADEDGFVLESYEGHDDSRPWMRLVEFHKH
jgi:hypothetical protein